MKTEKCLNAMLPAAACLMFAAGSAQAAYLSRSDIDCSPANVTITSIHKVVGSAEVYAGSPLAASSCYRPDGVKNDSGAFGLPAGENIGQLHDGLLNGGGKEGGIAPLTFISADQLLDLDGDGVATDPGWIYLGKHEGGGFSAWKAPLDIGSILDFQLTGKGASGSWTLSTKAGIVETVQSVLGRSIFDHLALILKAGSGYVVYDFDFNQLGSQLLAAGRDFDYETPYVFKGTWSTGDLDNKGLSHLSVWARDPLLSTASEVPEPGVLALLGVGLVLLRARTRKT